jgi:hypothetical protein
VNPKYIAALEEKGMMFVGQDLDAERMEIMQLQGMYGARVNVCICKDTLSLYACMYVCLHVLYLCFSARLSFS